MKTVKVSRRLLIVYYNHPQVVKKLEKHGHLIYTSKRMKYAYLYVNANDCKLAMNNLKNIRGVMKVEESLVDMSEFDFSL